MSASSPGTAGGILQGYGAYVAGNNQAGSMEYQATLAKQNAQLALQQGAFDAQRSQLQSAQRIGQSTAAYGAGGVSVQSGSPADVLAASASSATLDQMNIEHGADVKAINYENQASIDQLGAQQAQQSAKLGLLSGFIGGTVSGLSNQPGSQPEDPNADGGADETDSDGEAAAADDSGAEAAAAF